MNAWLIKVKITDYNILGAVREFGHELPWNFDDGKDACVGDKVYFYLTNATVKDAKNFVADGLLKRFLFKGEIKEITEKVTNDDSKYWTDQGHRNIVETQNETYAVIEIQESIYDKKVGSGDVDKRIWANEYSKKDVYKLDQKMIDSIEAHLK